MLMLPRIDVGLISGGTVGARRWLGGWNGMVRPVTRIPVSVMAYFQRPSNLRPDMRL
jgi:hypothetical protein